jgi:hypothetical protein
MCSPWAYNEFLEYGKVFPEIVGILKTHGVKAKVKPTKDKRGFFVQLALPDGTAVLSDGERDNWCIILGEEVIELSIPVKTRDARAITSALLKAIGK